MKRYSRRTLQFTFLFFLLGTLVLSGTAVAKTDSDIEDQTVQTSCSYNVSEFKIGSVPARFSSPEKLVNNIQYTDSNYIASEDWIAFEIPTSNNADCSHRDPVGSNLAYATPATPSANTTHTIVPKVNRSVTNVKQISIRYEIRPHLNQGIFQSNVTLFGIDEDRDGFIERSLNNSIEYVTAPNSHTIQIALNGNVTIPSDSYIIIRYESISNPDYEDTYSIKTIITGNRTATDSGHIRYESNLTGIVGYGVNLSIERGESQLVTLRPSKSAFANNSMYIFLPARQGLGHPQTYSITVMNTYQSDTSVSQSTYIMESIRVFDRFAYTFSNSRLKNGTITVSGYANLTPGSRISVQVFNQGRLREVDTKVRDSQFWSVKIGLPEELLNSKVLKVNVLDYNRTTIDKGILS